MSRPPITFDWRINLGHILVAISMLTAGTAAYVDLRRDISEAMRAQAVLEYKRSVQPQPKLGAWRDELDRLLAANAARSGRERVTWLADLRGPPGSWLRRRV